MKKLVYVLIVLGSGMLSTLNAQLCSRKSVLKVRGAAVRQADSLQLTTSIIQQKYCKNDDASLALQLKLLLRYANVGHQPLILYKGSKLIHRHTTSGNTEEAKAQRFITDYTVSNFMQGGEEINEFSLEKLFVTLQPGSTYEKEALTWVTLPIMREGAGLLPGEYVLQVAISTWPESAELARQLSASWQQSGLLWHDPVLSLPMPFKVESKYKGSDCSYQVGLSSNN